MPDKPAGELKINGVMNNEQEKMLASVVDVEVVRQPSAAVVPHTPVCMVPGSLAAYCSPFLNVTANHARRMKMI